MQGRPGQHLRGTRFFSARWAAAVVSALSLALLGASPLMTGAQAAAPTGAAVSVRPYRSVSHVVAAGDFTKIYDPSVGESGPWYINDHTILRGPDGTWHLFGITHPEPANPNDEHVFAHATAPTLHGPWTKQPFALTLDPAYGETHLWAPYVIKAYGIYYMFYAGGGPDPTSAEISVATSPDLWHWTRYAGDPLFRDGYDARDPFVLQVGGRWVMYYDATSDPAGGHHVVAYRTSTDLLHWGPRHIAFTDPSTGTFGGPTESPYVVARNGHYYLFIGPRGGYVGTDVFVSRDPLHFTPQQLTGHIAAHALEVVRDIDDSWYVTSAGWGQGGVYLAPLDWSRTVVTEGARVSTADYRATLQYRPTPQLVALSVPVGGRWRELLDNGFRGTEPYAGIGTFGATDRPGEPASVTWSADHRTVRLAGVPLGSQPVTLDWTWQFEPGWADMSIDWHVHGATTAPAWEVGWSLDTMLPYVGDETDLHRFGDVPGFPHWTLAGDESVSLVAAYRQGSAWTTTNRWYDPTDGALSWQPLWAPGGTAWPVGDYAGGTWRLGVSPHPADTGFADGLYAGVNG